MLWTWPNRWHGGLWSEMDRLQRDMNRLFAPATRSSRTGGDGFPPVNIWTSTDEALLTAEIPGIDPAKIDVSVKNDTVTIRGSREAEDLKEGEGFIRQERGAGSFVRSFALPFKVDGDKVSAHYRMGILQLTLPRLEDDKPKKISVNAG